MIHPLPVPKANVINHICHISDIHIRPGTDSKDSKLTRFEEYITVFQRIADFLSKQYTKNDLVICITGDIFHDNKKAGAPCIELFFEIIHILASIAPIYIIRGNHDYNQASISPQDMIGSFKRGLESFNNVAYIQDSGVYQAANIGFGVVAIQDALRAGDTHGRVVELPTFPCPNMFPDGVKKIAMFHGDVPNTYPLEWFGNGYDYILLGDLHRMQVHNANIDSDQMAMTPVHSVLKLNTYTQTANPLWAYPGSTIQQSFGETLLGHGFLMWNVTNNTIDSYHVPNEYGFITAKYSDDQWVVNTSFSNNGQLADKYIDLDIVSKLNWFPKNIRLRIKNTKDNVLHHNIELLDKLRNLNLVIETSKEVNSLAEDEDATDTSHLLDASSTVDLRDLNQSSSWVNYINQSAAPSDLTFTDWSQWFSNPSSLVLNDITIPNLTVNVQQDIVDRNKKINAAIDEYNKSIDISNSSVSSHTQFRLMYMDWAYILCYKDNCHFNFDNLDGQVHCISGKNAWGKTSFLETICIAIFGDGFPSRATKHYTSSIICLKKPKQQRAFTSIVISIDEVSYRIKRIFETQQDNKLHSKDIVLERLVSNNTWELVHSGKKAVSEWISRNIGTIESFLTSCMITQNFDEDFFQRKPADQKQYINEQLRLDSSTAFCNLLKVAYLAFDDIARKLKDLTSFRLADDAYTTFNHQLLADVTKQLEDVQKQIAIMQTRLGELPEWTSVNEDILKKGRQYLQSTYDELSAKLSDVQKSTEEKAVTVKHTDLYVEKGNLTAELQQLHAFRTTKTSNELLNEMAAAVNKKPSSEKPSTPIDVLQDNTQKLKTSRVTIKDTLISKEVVKLQQELQKTLQKITLTQTNITKTQVEYDSIAVGKANAIKKRDECLKNEPSPPTISAQQYDEWMNSLEPYVREYTTIENLQKLIHNYEKNRPTIDKPSMTAEEIEAAEVRLAKWLKQLQKTVGIDKGDGITICMDQYEQALKDARQKHDIIVNDGKKLVTDIADIEALANDVDDRLKERLAAAPQPPSIKTEAERKKLTTNRNKLEKQMLTLKNHLNSFTINQLKQVRESYPTLSIQLRNVQNNLQDKLSLLNTCEKHDFNPECAACMSHPWKKKLDEYTANCSALDKEQSELLNQMESAFGTSDIDDRVYKQVCEYLLVFEEFSKADEFLQNEKVVMEAYTKWTVDKKSLENELEHLRKQLATLHKKMSQNQSYTSQSDKNIESLQNKLLTITPFKEMWESEYHDLEYSIELNKQAILVWQPWLDKLADYNERLTSWSALLKQSNVQQQGVSARKTYQEWKGVRDDLLNHVSKLDTGMMDLNKKLQSLRQDLEVLRSSTAVCEQNIRNKNEVIAHAKDLDVRILHASEEMSRANAWNEYETCVHRIEKSIRAVEVESALQQVDQLIDNKRVMDQLTAQLSQIGNALNVIDVYNEYIELKRKLQDLVVMEQTLMVHHEQLLAAQKRYEETKHTVTILSKNAQLIASKSTTAKAILDQLVEFKDRAIKDHIIPLIVQKVNWLLSIMCQNHRSISLDCIFDNKGMFNWYVEDGGNKPPIEKASGFQRFVIALAMRIVLGRLGVAGIKNTQLFIDEGFTACDTDNLSNVPDVLEELLDIYKAVVIVSHLEDLKHGVKSINIERREDHSSVLKFGPINEMYATVKKVGRPAKKSLLG
jgi:DNA repair exonuclease SbcCD ATPase subunit